MLAAAMALLGAACSSGGGSSAPSSDGSPSTTSTDSTTTTAPVAAAGSATTTEAASGSEPSALALGELDYTITSPPEWSAETRGTITIMAETRGEVLNQFQPESGPATALSVSFDHRDTTFLAQLGFDPDNPSATDLIELNTRVFGWRDLHGQEEVELLGTTAIKVEGTSTLGVFVAYQGVNPETEQFFFLGLLAPSAEELDAFRPTWATMLDSITAQG